MKYQVLIQILFMLLAREKVTAKQIADRFDISIRTVYRYIDELSISIPIYNARGREGGYKISENYKIPATFLTEDEKSTLLGILENLKTDLNSKTLKNITEKLTAISKNQQSAPISFGNLVIDSDNWSSTDIYKETLVIMENSIENKLKVKIEYANRNGENTERVIEPHTLVLKAGLWYLYAYCHLRNGFRLFKIGRILSVTKTNEVFERRSVEGLDYALTTWYDNLEKQDIDLEISSKIMPEIEEWLGVNAVTKSTSGKIYASCKLPLNKEVTAKILSFGSEVKVLSPKELILSVKNYADEITNLYK